ncbi:stromal interaction molecule homolog [Panonychus citri]|uniref:stromal interaction molecule homolog n=1 Tax=Panonychus citri TaxID=50023 RepID=UPI002307752D|nr:stromal interaction molecule homolog [Panonychus citri]
MINLFNLKFCLLLTIKVSLVQSNDANQHQDIITVNLKDPWGYEAIKQIHNKIDYDQNGSIERKESIEFIVKDLKTNEGNEADKKEMTLHAGDSSISVDEMWETWRKSEVSKWSVDETINWLINHVKLPQYTDSFIENHIDGSRLPRIAANPAFATHILKITDPLDRQRLTLNAIEAVLFGVSNDRFLLDRYLITVLIGVAFILWFVLNQRRNVQHRLDKVFRQMSTLQESRDKLLTIQRELEKTKEGKQQVIDETENLTSILRSQSSSDLVYQRDQSLQEKGSSLIKEIAATRRSLAKAELMLSQTPFERIQQQKIQLQRWLQITYEIENKNYNEQKTQYEAELIKLKNKLGGKRKKTNRKLSEHYYEDLKATRLRLTGLINQIEICRDKWIKIENLCGFPIRDNPGLPVLQQVKPPNLTRMSSVVDESETSDHEDESFTPSPDINGEFFPEFQFLHRPSSRTGDYSTTKLNSSKQLMRLMSNDEPIDSVSRYPLRTSRSTYFDRPSNDSMTMKTNEQNLSTRSSNPSRRHFIRRSSSLQDILFQIPKQSRSGKDVDFSAEI